MVVVVVWLGAATVAAADTLGAATVDKAAAWLPKSRVLVALILLLSER